MENKDKEISQEKLANDISQKIEYEFTDLFLVKTMEPIKVKKEFSKPIPAKEQKPNEDGAIDFDDVETEVKEVDSDYRKGVVVKVPTSYSNDANRREDIKVGDIVVFKPGMVAIFDWLPDTVLVSRFAITAVQHANA